jgi:acyl-coenzyme A thioesterase 13
MTRLDFFRTQIGQDASQSPSGLGRWLNGIVRVAEPDHFIADYEIRPDMTNPMNVMHGGTAAAIMDDIAGMLVFALGREFGYTSVNLNVDFLNPARAGDVVTATAKIIRAGKNIVHAEVTLTAADGKLIAKSATNLVQTSVRLPF